MSNFKVFNSSINLSTKGEIEFVDLTRNVLDAAARSGVRNGLVHIFAPHATGIVILTENESGLLEDIERWLQEIIPKNRGYEHPSNAYAHLRSVLLPPDRTIPIIEGRVELGTWQSVLFVETDVHPRRRTVIIQVLGSQ